MGKGVKLATESSIQIEFIYQGVRCRERIKFNPSSTEPAVALKKVERHREAICHAIDDGTFNYAAIFPKSKNLKKFASQNTLTLSAWLDQWINRKEPHLKVSTFDGYLRRIERIKAQFGSTPITDIKKKDVRAWCESMTTTNRDIRNTISPLRSALQDAYEDGLIHENPLFNFNFNRKEAPKVSDVDPFNIVEREAILSATTGQIRNLFQFAFWTGLRTSELVALEWGDVNWLRETFLVQRAKTQWARVPEATKTKAGNREVKLLTPAMSALKAQKEFSFKAGKHIFLNPKKNAPWTGDQQIRNVWVHILRNAGVRYRRPYQTRHTYASMMLSAGEPLAWVSKQIGHSNVIMTATVYATWINDCQPDVGSKAVNLFNVDPSSENNIT